MGPGTRPLPVTTVISCVCLLGMPGTHGDTPPYRVHATGSTSAHARSNSRESRFLRMCRDTFSDAPKRGVASLGYVLIKTGSELDWNYALLA